VLKQLTSKKKFHALPLDASDAEPIARPKARYKHAVNLNLLQQMRMPLDAASRARDGLIPAALLLAVTLMMDMFIYPIQAAASHQGLLIYLVLTLALGVFALEKTTSSRGNETSRAISGIIAGLFFWHSLWLIQLIGAAELNPQTTFLVLVLVMLIGLTLWRPVLPLGVKFFLLSFVAGWVNRFYITHTISRSTPPDVFTLLFYTSGFLALAGVIFGLVYLIYRAEFKVQRLWAALGIWQACLITLTVIFKIFL